MRKMIEYLYFSLLLTGAMMVFFAAKFYISTQKLIQNGIVVNATVIDLVSSGSRRGATYKPVFEFSDISGNKQQFTSTIASRPPAYTLGEVVPIIYDAQNADAVATIGFWGLYRWTIVLLSIATPLLIIGGGYFLFKFSHTALFNR